MIAIDPDFETGFAGLQNTRFNNGYVHDCGFIVFAAEQPKGCMECRSHLRNAQSNHGKWHQLYIRWEEGQ